MRLASVALVGLAVLLASPPAGRGMTLEDALVQIYLQNPRLEGARARLRAVDEEVPGALAGWRPRLSATTGTALEQTSTEQGDQTLAMLRQALTLTQPVYTGGATRADTSRAENAVRAERARLTETEQEVLLDGVETYTAVSRDQAVLELARRNERRLIDQLAATRDRFRFGELTKTDVAQAETRLARARADRAQADGEVAGSNARFRRVVGKPPDGLVTAEPLDDIPELGNEIDAVVDRLPPVAAARYALDGARDEVALAKSELLPRVTVDGEIGYANEPSTSIDREGTLRLGASISIPLYQGGAEYARVRGARQRASERRNALDDARRTAVEALASARADLTALRARIASLEVATDRATFALDGVREEALVGARTVLDVLDAEQEEFTAEVDLTRVRREEVVASYRLHAAAGQLDAATLALPVQPYDAEAHYREVRDKWIGLGEDDSP